MKDGETDAEEIAEEVEKNDISNIDIDEMFTEDAIGHLDRIDGFDKRDGVSGAHTPKSFKKFMDGPHPVEILGKEKIYDDIYETKYKVGKIDRANNPILKPDDSYDFFRDTFKKTIIDTSELNVEQITSMAKEAFTSKNIYIRKENTIYIKGTSINGVKFEGWINSKTKQLESFYPVKDWRYDY